jgi:hypothetical protein
LRFAGKFAGVAVGTTIADRPPQSGRTVARSGLRMMPTFPPSPYHSVRRVFPSTAGRLACPTAPSRCLKWLKPAPGICQLRHARSASNVKHRAAPFAIGRKAVPPLSIGRQSEINQPVHNVNEFGALCTPFTIFLGRVLVLFPLSRSDVRPGVGGFRLTASLSFLGFVHGSLHCTNAPIAFGHVYA